MLKRLICLFLAGIMICALPAVCRADTDRSAGVIAKEIVNTWGKTGEEADFSAQWAELNRADPVLAGALDKILLYWHFLDHDRVLNEGCLPDGMEHPEQTCLVVLGFSLNPDGSMKPELLGRLQVALACAEKYPGMTVLCTGGGTASGNREATEAGKMGEWLVQNGLDPARLLIEDQSRSTDQNALYSARTLCEKAPWVTDIVIVSSDYHINWGALLFEAAFILEDAFSDAPRGLHVVSNAAYPCGSKTYSNPRSVMTTQLITLIGNLYTP